MMALRIFFFLAKRKEEEMGKSRLARNKCLPHKVRVEEARRHFHLSRSATAGRVISRRDDWVRTVKDGAEVLIRLGVEVCQSGRHDRCGRLIGGGR